MSDTVVFDGELSLEIPLDGECQTVYNVGHEPVINALTATINGTYTAEGDGFNPVIVAVPEPTHDTETWTFTLDDDSIVEKVVILDD